MKLRLIFAIIGMACVCGCSTVKPQPISRRDAWIRDAVQKLKAFKPTSETPRVGFEKSGNDIMLTVTGSTLLEDQKGNWAYFLSYSSHLDDCLGEVDESGEIVKMYEPIGDVALAIDNTGTIYQSNSHICAGIISMILLDEPGPRMNDINDVLSMFHKKEVL